MGVLGWVSLVFDRVLYKKNSNTPVRFQTEPPERSDGVVMKRSAESPSCVVVTIPGDYQGTELAFEFRLTKHDNKFMTPGVQTALESVWRDLPVKGDVPQSLFVASEALGFCDRQLTETAVPSCEDSPPFLLRFTRAREKQEFVGAWPVWVPVLSSVGVLTGMLSFV
jgi:hypothetical protein